MQAALVILDGWGLADHDRRNAIEAAETPTFDRVRREGAFGTLCAYGRSVGLPDDQMGNSEVGHLTIGAGRVIEQPYTRIDDAIAADELCENEAIAGALDAAETGGGRIHFLGLVSDGGVHADQAHLHALLECAADRGIDAVTHAFTDGRDTSPTGGEEYLADLSRTAERLGTGHVATVIGRYYAMDRDENWTRTHRAYDGMVNRRADYRSTDAVGAVRSSYERGATDEFVEPTLIESAPAIAAGDSVFVFNFRGDRARQIVRMLGDVDPAWDVETDPPDVHLATMTEYDPTFPFPVAFPPIEPTDTLGAVLAREGLTQLRIAESEKYPHVTYFLNGGREVTFEGEIRRIVESPDVPTYDLEPAMSAEGVTDAAISVLESDDPDVLILNYANPDMVGHTGDFDAAIAAVEAVDTQVDRLLDALQSAGAHVLVTADHGNADDLGVPGDPHTAHTFNPVPCVYLDPAGTDGGLCIRDGGDLSDLAPTLLSLLGIEKPGVMTGESLLVDQSRPS
ncbi:MAG: 2,3-bisphosphoglycerate-independent phosphoglycerate mutase [Halanaeroarchaeum sp.]